MRRCGRTTGGTTTAAPRPRAAPRARPPGTTGTTGGGSTSGTTTGGQSGGGAGGISGGGFAGGGGGQGGAGRLRRRHQRPGQHDHHRRHRRRLGDLDRDLPGQPVPRPLPRQADPRRRRDQRRRPPELTGDLGIPLIQGSASAIAPFNAVPGAGATLGISFLSDLEMYLFLTAAQGDARNNIVQAPKITTFNGANASITNAEVPVRTSSSLTPIVGFWLGLVLPAPRLL